LKKAEPACGALSGAGILQKEQKFFGAFFQKRTASLVG
jgi:hypothetical protein